MQLLPELPAPQAGRVGVGPLAMPQDFGEVLLGLQEGSHLLRIVTRILLLLKLLDSLEKVSCASIYPV